MLQLYDLAGEDPDHRFSPYCWRVRMALAHKGVEVETIPWRYHDKHKIAATGQGEVPVLLDGKQMIPDSWDIARYLEAKYPDRPTLFAQGEMTRAIFIKHWMEKTIHPLISRLVVLDVLDAVHPDDRTYFRISREERFGMSLEKFTAAPLENVRILRAALEPLRLSLGFSPFLGGNAPDFADYIAFGAFQWARCATVLPLLEPDDPIFYWREQLLHSFDGLAFRTPHRETTPQRRRSS